MHQRWDGDERGRGIADARRLLDGAGELVAAFRQPEWVAEDPELNIKPHVEAWCRADGRLELTDAHRDEDGGYVLNMTWRGAPAGPGQLRAAVYAVIGQFAESATYVRQWRVANARPAPDLRFEVGTGEVDAGSRFAPHGHVIVINVVQPG